MVILLINPPDRQIINPEMDPPFNLMMLATSLRRHDIQVEIGEWATNMPVNMPVANVYGITLTTPTCDSAKNVAVRIREQYPASKIIVGGPHAMTQVIDWADITAKGHCLDNISEIINSPEGVYQGETNLVMGYPLSWDLINVPKYINNRYIPECQNTISYISSIGCPLKCHFCYNPYLNFKHEIISIDSFTKDISYLVHNYNIDGINFLDDNFILDESSLSILRHYSIGWRAELSINYLTDIKKLKDNNCKYIVIGIESGSDRMLESMNKPQRVQNIELVVNKLNDAGIKVRGLFMVGFPGETWQSIEETATLIRKIPFDSISINLFVPYPGTEAFHNPTRFGINFISKDFSKFRSHPIDGMLTPVFRTSSLDEQTLINMHSFLESVKKTESL